MADSSLKVRLQTPPHAALWEARGWSWLSCLTLSHRQNRLRDHAKAFDGLLSLIPAKMYYGEDTSVRHPLLPAASFHRPAPPATDDGASGVSSGLTLPDRINGSGRSRPNKRLPPPGEANSTRTAS